MWLLTLSLLCAADTVADVPGAPWANRTESASVRLREASDQLAATASSIAQAGRLQELAVLHSDADDVVFRAGQLLLWANQAPSLARPAAPPAAPGRAPR
ncbi:MAG: hypothetical protein EXR69_08705 [Myxococcales bacterium]|nr:hypothetical protein [Myxococcales bacterium]